MTDLRHRADLSPGGYPLQGHFGLMLDKLAARYNPKEPDKLDKEEVLCRLMGYKPVPGGPSKPPERRPFRQRTIGEKEQPLLDRQHSRLDALVAASGSSRTYVTIGGPLAIGLGNSSPLENGLTSHPTYGVPFIPGSAIKGMLGAWAEHWCDATDERMVQLFGRGRGEQEARRIGAVTFLDALPRPPVKVVVDVMTPHAGPYYGDNPLPPADWHSPNPIPFIAVPEGQCFAVRFLVNGRARLGDTTAEALVEEIDRMLEAAFETIGIGAKTAAGYGRLALDA